MQLLLLTVTPSIAQVSSLALCGLIVGRVHYKMVTSRTVMSTSEFHTVVLSCVSIQVVCKIIESTGLSWMQKIMQIGMFF